MLSKKFTRALSSVSALILVLGLFVSSCSLTKAADSRFFSETGKTVSGKFLDYWQNNGGLATYGFPITEAQPEVDPETGQTFLTQWFERNRFELHPENAGTKYEVLMGLLGKDLKREALEIDPDYIRNTALTMPGWYYFAQTGHNVSPDFLQYWQDSGGLERFGYPISEQVREIDPQTNKLFVMQWFERARFEFHPENKVPYRILLGLLGNQLKNSRSGSLEYSWKTGSNPSFLREPSGLAVDSNDNIYVTDHDKSSIFKYNSNNVLVMKWSIYDAAGTPKHLDGVAVDRQDNVYVIANNILYKFDKNAHPIADLVLKLDIFGEPVSTPFKVDSDGNIYVINNLDTIKKFNSSGKLVLQWGSSGTGNGQFQNPTGLALDNQGNVFVLDNTRVQKFSSSGYYLASWKVDNFGLIDRELATDSQNNVYVANNYLFKYDSSGKFLAKSTKTLSQYGSSSNLALAVTSQGTIVNFSTTKLYKFSDTFAAGVSIGAVINRYDQQGNLLQTWGNSREKEGYFVNPGGMVFSNNSNDFYILDLGNNRVQAIDRTGHYLRSWELAEITLGQDDHTRWIDLPQDLAVDRQGNTFVIYLKSVRKYNSAGQMVAEWEYKLEPNFKPGLRKTIAVDSTGSVYIGQSGHIKKYTNNGQPLTEWSTSGDEQCQSVTEMDMAVNSQDNLYVVNGSSCIQKFDSSGKLLKNLGNQPGLPIRIAIDSQDSIYTSEYFANQIHKINDDGVLLGAWPVYWGIIGACGSQACSIRDMALDNQNNIYITYAGNDFIQKAHLR